MGYETIRLRIRSVRGETLMELLWRDGATTVVQAEPEFVESAERWTTYGLDEWVGAQPRFTPPTAEEFLPRLDDYLARQFIFRLTLVYS